MGVRFAFPPDIVYGLTWLQVFRRFVGDRSGYCLERFWVDEASLSGRSVLHWAATLSALLFYPSTGPSGLSLERAEPSALSS